jgi:hypothetical protein
MSGFKLENLTFESELLHKKFKNIEINPNRVVQEWPQLVERFPSHLRIELSTLHRWICVARHQKTN